MRVAKCLAAIPLVLALSSASGVQAAPRRATLRPVVVELYTAQGCASCPQANQMVAGMADQRGLIVLTLSVDYWDYLGWKDTFAMPAFTDRQRAYVRRLKLKEVYTPEVVVGGRREAPAVDQDKVEDLVEREAKSRGPAPRVAFARKGTRVTVGQGEGGGEVWLVRYDPKLLEVKVKAGENAGKTVSHLNVVRELTRLGTWAGEPRTYKVPEASADGLDAVAILQGRGGGPILAAAKN